MEGTSICPPSSLKPFKDGEREELNSPLTLVSMLLARRANSSMLQRSSANRPSSACLPALRGVDGRGQRGDGGESAHCPSSARPPIRCRRWGRRRPRIGRIITRPTQSGLSGSLSASLSLKPLQLQSIAVASWRVGVEWMGGWGRGREGGREGGSLMLQPFQKAADSLARSHARLAP